MNEDLVKKRLGLYLSQVSRGGGAFQYSMSVLEAMGELPVDQYAPVVVYSQSEWSDIVARHNVAAIYAPISPPLKLFAYSWRKAGLSIALWRKFLAAIYPPTRRLRSLDCSLWIFPSQDPMTYLLPDRALSTVHDLMHRYEGRFPELAGYRMRELHYCAVCRYASGVLVDSDLGKRQLVESYQIEPNRVHPLPFIPASYMYATEDPSDLMERYKLPAKFLFYPAQFWQHKNHQQLLRAAKRLSDELPDIRFVFVGTRKNGYQALVRLANELGLSGRIHVLGYVPNEYMPGLYRRARAMVMPSFLGPTNIPPLEAMVVGCPVAVSNIYAMPEQCGDAALYFDPRSEASIADCIARLWTDDALCRELSKRGKKRAALFSQEAFNRRLLDIVGRILGVPAKMNLVTNE